MTRCPCGLRLVSVLCVIGHDPTPARRTKVHTVTRDPLEREANPFRKGKAVKKTSWPAHYRIGEVRRG